MKEEANKVFIYSRKSIYTGKGESIDNQIEMCKQYIFSNLENVSEDDVVVYEDEGFSGKNLARPEFQKMLRDIENKQCKYIVCYRLDRISRSVSDFSSLIEDLTSRDISFICIKEKFDTSNPMGKAMMYITSVFAQLERETIAERVRDNMLMLARTGRWLGGTTPTGFVSEKVENMIVDDKIKTCCKLKHNPDEIIVVKKIYEKFLELRSISGVGKFLEREGYKSRTGKPFSTLGIKEILQNPVYCIADKDALDYFTKQNADVCFDESQCSGKRGLMSYNKRDYKKKHAPRQSVENWIIAIGKHDGIARGQDWVAVQLILKENKPNSNSTKVVNPYSLLSGILTCSKCGSRMFTKIHSTNSNIFYYMCCNKLRFGTRKCDCKNLNGQQADDMVCNFLMDYTNENLHIYKLLELLKSNIQNQTEESPIDQINLKIKKCNEEMDNLVNVISKANYSSEFIEKINCKAQELEERLKSLITQRDQLLNNKAEVFNNEIQLELLAKTLSDFKSNFKNLTIQEKRTFIKILVQKIEWDGQDFHIFIYGE